jgi:glycine/D-amino acid oxidase-like deaminating enzyme
MMIEPNRYLRALLEEFFAAGGLFERRDLRSIQDVPGELVFNCLGLGAREVFSDSSLLPIRGQLVVLLPQPGLDYNLLNQGFYLFPRRDGVLLGGTFDRGVESLEPDPAVTARLLEGHRQIAARFTS